tara:strand:- start:17 stop:424 length:408 start_codon:yes stop_codon:yes gene_type:complete
MMEHLPDKLPKLTKNQDLVMGVLSKVGHPMSAYAILDILKENGLKAPLQVYRALERLEMLGLVHRIECMNAFVACRHDVTKDDSMVAFIICNSCGDVKEVSDNSVEVGLHKVTKRAGFILQKPTIELQGICRSCR